MNEALALNLPLLFRELPEAAVGSGPWWTFGLLRAKELDWERDNREWVAALPAARFVLDEVLDVLSTPAFREAAGLRPDDWQRLRHWLDEAGASGREAANQLGHAKPSMTQDHYMSRRTVTEQAAVVL